MGRAYLRGFVPVYSHRLKQAPDICFLGVTRASRGRLLRNASAGPAPRASDDASRRGPDCYPSPTEGESRWTSGCAGRFGSLGRPTGTAPWLEGTVVPGADEVRGR